MPTDTDRLFDMLHEIRNTLAEFVQDSGKRLAALEERCKPERFDAITRDLNELQQFKAMVKVYIAAAAFVASTVTGVAIAALKLWGHS